MPQPTRTEKRPKTKHKLGEESSLEKQNNFLITNVVVVRTDDAKQQANPDQEKHTPAWGSEKKQPRYMLAHYSVVLPSRH